MMRILEMSGAPQAKLKSWFGIRDSFERLQRDWTIFRETMQYIIDMGQVEVEDTGEAGAQQSRGLLTAPKP